MYKAEELICLFITLPILSFLEFRAYVVRFFLGLLYSLRFVGLSGLGSLGFGRLHPKNVSGHYEGKVGVGHLLIEHIVHIDRPPEIRGPTIDIYIRIDRKLEPIRGCLGF